MFRQEAIQALFGRVGFRQPTQAEYAGLLEPGNTQSRSGRRFDDFHSIVTIPNIREAAINEVGVNPADFNKYLEELQTSCIAAVLDGVFSKPELVEQQMLYERDYEAPELLANAGKFVGYMVQIGNRTNISVHINALSLLFKGAGTFNLYIYHHLKKSPIHTIPVTVIPDEEVIVTPASELILTAIGSQSKSRTYYIGYFQNDINALGIQAYDYGMHLKRTAFFYSADGMEADVTGGDFDRYNPPLTGRTYGLNMELSSFRDYTEVIIRNQRLFDKAIGLQMAALIIEKIVNGTRSNLTQRLTAEGIRKLYADLNLAFSTPEMPYTTGIRNQLDREIKRIHGNLFPKGKIKTVTVSEPWYTRRHRQ